MGLTMARRRVGDKAASKRKAQAKVYEASKTEKVESKTKKKK